MRPIASCRLARLPTLSHAATRRQPAWPLGSMRGGFERHIPRIAAYTRTTGRVTGLKCVVAASPSWDPDRGGAVRPAQPPRRRGGSEVDGEAGRLRIVPTKKSSGDSLVTGSRWASAASREWGRGEYRSAHGNGSRPRVPSMRGTGSRSREVRRGAATTRNVPAVSRGTCARSRRRGQRVEGRAAHAAIRRRARWGRLVAEANTRPDHRCRDFTKAGRLAGRICSLPASARRQRTAEAAARAPSARPATAVCSPRERPAAPIASAALR